VLSTEIFAARALRIEATKDQVKDLKQLQEAIDKLPGKLKHDVKYLSPENYKIYQDLLKKQRDIAEEILNAVLKKHPEWKDKIKPCP